MTTHQMTADRAARRGRGADNVVLLPVPGNNGRLSGPRTRRRTPVRLTRRGRVVLALLITLVATGAVLAFGTSGGAAPPPRPVQVQRGDTLWSLADRYAATRDPVTAVERIRRLNCLSGYDIYPGQRLLIPAAGTALPDKADTDPVGWCRRHPAASDRLAISDPTE